MIQSEAGFLSVTGSEHEPAKAGLSIADIAAGMYAYTNILAALLERGRTGRGAHLDISMLESLVEWMSYPLYYAYDGAPPPARTGASHATIYPYGPFPAGDGKTVMLGLQNEREWTAFCAKVLLQPDARERRALLEQLSPQRRARRVARADRRRSSRKLTAEQVVARLDDAQIANAQVNDMKAVWAHPQLRARRRWNEVDSPAGRIPALLPPGARPDDPPPSGGVPALGAHTDAILASLGYSAGAIAKLHADKAI